MMAEPRCSEPPRRHNLLAEVVAPAALMISTGLILPAARAGHPPLETWQERRDLMLRLRQEQQLRLQQQVVCLQKAGSMADLERCSTVFAPGWMPGQGMGGWGWPMW